jgi:carboxypeptidase PM20D1
MRTLVRVLGALALVVAVLAVVVVARTLMLKPPSKADAIAFAPAPAVDVNRAAERLGEAIRFQTISHQDAAQDDPKAWENLRNWLASTYPAFHAAAAREMIGTGALVWTWTGSDPALQPIVLMAHQDVVPVEAGSEGRWTHPPFDGVVKDGAVWGRGAIDDKGSLIALMESVDALAASGFKPKRTVIIVSNDHEEKGGEGAQLAAKMLAARGVRAQFVLDEGMNVITDNPVTGKTAALVGVAEKGYATLRVTARSPGGHSSMPPKQTAVVTLAQAVSAIADHPFPSKLGGVTGEMLDTLGPDTAFVTRMAIANRWLFGPLLKAKFGATPPGAALLHTTIAPTMLEGSPKDNVLPQTAIARINFRIAPGDTSASVMAHCKEAVKGLGVDLAWEETPNEPTAIASTKSDGWKLISGLAAEMSGAPVAPALMIAGTDSRYMAPIASDIYKFEFLTASMADQQMIHGTNEHITLDQLDKLTTYFGRLVATAAAR